MYQKIRFTLKEEGEYLFTVTLKNGETLTESITAEGFINDGYIKPSEKDPRYFSYTNGKGYFPIGVNICFPRQYPVSNNSEFGSKDEVCYLGLRQYERWFKKFTENGIDLVRLWLGHHYFTPDTLDAEVLDYAQFSKIDAIIDLAKKYGLKLKLTFEHFRYTNHNDSGAGHGLTQLFNKPIRLNGEYCSSINEWTTEEKWKKAWLNKVHEFAKRYAGDTEIFAFELWNEMNCLPNTNEWNSDMLPRVKSFFPDNMVINSLGSMDSESAAKDYATFPWHLSDARQYHRYLDQGAKLTDAGINPIETVLGGAKRMGVGGSPLILAETGGVNNCHVGEFKHYSADDRGMILVDCVYTPVFSGLASCGHIWHWDHRYIESKNLHKYFAPIKKLTKDIDFTKENFEVLNLSDDDVYLLILKGKNVALGFIRNKEDCWQNVLRDMKDTEKAISKTFDFAADSVEQIAIWDEDTTEIKIENNKLIFDNLLYGTTFMIK